jgi:prefoldin subunit 5
MSIDDLIFAIMNEIRKDLNEEIREAANEAKVASNEVKEAQDKKADPDKDAGESTGAEGTTQASGTKDAKESDNNSEVDAAKDKREEMQEKLQQLIKAKDQFMSALSNVTQAMHQTAKAGINNIRV